MRYQPVETHENRHLRIVPAAGEIQQIKEKWVDMLLKNPEIVGQKGTLGRNNAVFTLSLAYYASAVEMDRCQDDMDLFNSNLDRPLKVKEVEKIVKSAYSGRYRGANKEKVLELLANWGSESLSEDQLFTQKRSHWCKFKKDRSERKKSHIHEWKIDILEYLETQCYRYRPEIELKKADIQAAISYTHQGVEKNIPKRSLDKALNELKAEGQLFIKIQAGRGGGLIVATRKSLIRTVIVVNRHVKDAYKKAIRTFFREAAMLTKMIETGYKEDKTGIFEVQLNLRDTG